MFYSFSLTVPANTLATAPETLEINLDVGVIVGATIQFPRGCVGMVNVRVRQELFQLYPRNTDGSIVGENATIPLLDEFPLTDAPYVLTLEGWSPGTTYAHAISFTFNLQPIEGFQATRQMGDLASGIRRLIASLGRRL